MLEIPEMLKERIMQSKPKVVISPGHTAEMKGAEKNGYTEYEVCAAIVKYFDDVPYIETIDEKLSERIRYINEVRPSIAVEVHLGNSNMYNHFGTKAFFMIYDKASQQLAESLAVSVATALGNRGYKIYPGWFKKVTPKMVATGKVKTTQTPKMDYFLEKVSCTPAQIEPFFLSNIQEVKSFCNEDYYKKIAYAIKDGIDNYLRSNGNL